MILGEALVQFKSDASATLKAMNQVADVANKANVSLKSGLDKVKQSLEKAEAGSKAFAGTLVAAGAAVVAFGAKSVQAYNESVQAQTKLATNLLAVKGNTMENVDSLGKLASQLQSVGVIEDDVIKAGMSQLATFSLQGKTIETLTPKITDMVAQLKGHNATAEDMVAINNLVGKVMTGNIGALSKYGVTLSETQKEQMKNANETERANLLVEVLSQNYGKVNEELRKTPQGVMTGLKNDFGDFMELVGEGISNYFTPLALAFDAWFQSIGGPEGAMKLLNEKLQWILDNGYVIAGIILGGITPALYGMATGVWAVMAPLIPFLIAGAALGLLIQQLIQHFGGVTETINVLRPVLETMYSIWTNFIYPSINSVWTVIRDQLLPALRDLWTEVGPILLPVLKFLGEVIGVVIVAAIIGLAQFLRVLVTGFSNLVEAATWIIDKFKAVGSWIWNTSDAFRGMLGPIGLVVSAVKGLIDNFNKVKDVGTSVLKKLGIPGFATGVRNFAGGLAMVGENGPELVALPRGSNVYNTADTRSILNSGGNTSTKNININIDTIHNTEGKTLEKIGMDINRGIELADQGVFNG